MTASQRRVRRANDDLERRYVELEVTGRLPFICECANERCTRVIRLTLEEYDEARAEPRHFVAVPGHVLGGRERVVYESDRYAVLEKRG